MRHARLQKLQRFRLKMPFYSFFILWFNFIIDNGLKSEDLSRKRIRLVVRGLGRGVKG